MLILFYSLSGNTRAVANALAQEFGADIEEIRCNRYSRGFFGLVRAAYDSWTGRRSPIAPLQHGLGHYDVVLIGGPIWAFHPAPPLRALVRREASQMARVGFFLTHGGSAGEKSLRELERLTGKAPIATLLVREGDIKAGKAGGAVSSLAASLRGAALA
jgi:flavodoxin